MILKLLRLIINLIDRGLGSSPGNRHQYGFVLRAGTEFLIRFISSLVLVFDQFLLYSLASFLNEKTHCKGCTVL